MPTNLDITATEQGTIVVNAAFTDEDNAAVVPVSVTWTLTDASGNVINSRSDQTASPAASVDIVLSGDDLAIQAGETALDFAERRILIKATYDSTLGSDLPLRKSGAFRIENLVAVS